MKLEQLTIKNIKSFRDEQTVSFKSDLNIFIGSNASGKNNLLDIIHIVTSYYFVYPWKLKAVAKQGLAFSYAVIDSIYDGRKHFEPIEQFLDRNIFAQQEEQLIKISFRVTSSDVESLKTIKKYEEALKKIERRKFHKLYLGDFSLKGVNIDKFTDKIFEYQIIGNEPIASEDQHRADIFLNYLHYHELIRFYINKYNEDVTETYRIRNLLPISQYLSSLRTSAAQAAERLLELDKKIDPLKGFEEDFVIFTLGKQNEQAVSKGKKQIIKGKKNEELLKSIIKKLGYESIMLCKSEKHEGYELSLKKDRNQKYFSKASTGELQILNFLLSVITSCIYGGTVIIGEPEIHLYPQRQRIMLDLFRKLSKLFDLQFIIITHSPYMIDAKSITSTFRVYKENESSRVYSPNQTIFEETDSCDLVLIINVLNNEKIFFSEKVVLVEGIADRIIFEIILRILQEKKNNFETIEIIDVFGKGNLKRFKNFLAEWNIKSYIIADDDYADDLLREHKRKIEKKEFIASLWKESVYILPKGDLEDYFHEGHFDIDEAIEIAQQIQNKDRIIPDELRTILEEIIRG
ncbi:MAG: AAA family ATPase [Patescibacteria group bacterium]|nr:AAA family ATPase [Patescibacteria group bacterium]